MTQDSKKVDDPAAAVIEPLATAAAVLAKVTDEASAKEAKPQLDKLYDEAEAASKRLEGKEGEGKSPDAEAAKRMGEVRDKLQSECDRIATKHKSAFGVLRETKLFGRLSGATDDTATMRAMSICQAGKVWEVKSGGNQLTQLVDLADYLEDGKDGLVDPWGGPFQFKYVEDKKTGLTRLVIWTINPQTDRKVGWPKELVDEKE